MMMKKLIILLIVFLLTSTLIACNDDKEINSDELKYTYELTDITDIEINIFNLRLKISNLNMENEYNEAMKIEVSSKINIQKNINKIILFSSSKDVIEVKIFQNNKDNLSINITSDYLINDIENIKISALKVDSKYCECNINQSNITTFTQNTTTSIFWIPWRITNSYFKEMILNYEKAYPIISNCEIGTINITNNYGYTEFLKNSFNELNYNSINGKIFMELDPNYGYTFDYNIKTYWSAFEPDQSNPGYYVYGDGQRKINVDAPKGDMEIMKYR